MAQTLLFLTSSLTVNVNFYREVSLTGKVNPGMKLLESLSSVLLVWLWFSLLFVFFYFFFKGMLLFTLSVVLLCLLCKITITTSEKIAVVSILCTFLCSFS